MCTALPNNQGVDDEDCIPCSQGQTQWPCGDALKLCDCSEPTYYKCIHNQCVASPTGLSQQQCSDFCQPSTPPAPSPPSGWNDGSTAGVQWDPTYNGYGNISATACADTNRWKDQTITAQEFMDHPSHQVTLKDGSTITVDIKSVGHVAPALGEPDQGNCGKCFVMKVTDDKCSNKDASVLVMGVDVSGDWSPEVSQEAEQVCRNPDDADYHWTFQWQEIQAGSYPGCQN